ncbi:MAG: transposase [Gammaproteobacteria bacterium]|nr:transposase [Gammaproteobacteria bacterium]
MARLPRFFVPGQPLHAIQRGNNREAIFAAPEDYARFLEFLHDGVKRYACAIHAYVLMTNHFHLLVTPAKADSLSKLFQSVGRRYVQYFNFTYKRSGTLWEGRYRAAVIDAEHYLLTCMRYIELNPVRADMVEHPADYPYSSYVANAQGKADPLIAPHSIYRRLAKSDVTRQAAYRQLFRAHLSHVDLESIRDTLHKGWALGNPRFRAKIETLSGRRAAPLPKGRPRRR